MKLYRKAIVLAKGRLLHHVALLSSRRERKRGGSKVGIKRREMDREREYITRRWASNCPYTAATDDDIMYQDMK
jgi:hypothetical protein